MIKYFTTVFHIFIFETTIYKFMEYIPPCKDCIVQSMCLETNNDHINKSFIITRKCSTLRKYLEQNNSFVIIKEKFIFKRKRFFNE